MENVNLTTTTTTAATSTTTTTAAQSGAPVPITTQAPQGEKSSQNIGDKVDMTSIVRGKKINPKTGTQTTEDDPNGVWADNVHNETQIEHAGHTQTQATPGAGEILADTIEKTSGNDGNKTATQAKVTNENSVQNDDFRARSDKSEEVVKDGQIQQGETGAEDRPDLQDGLGGASGSNRISIP